MLILCHMIRQLLYRRREPHPGRVTSLRNDFQDANFVFLRFSRLIALRWTLTAAESVAAKLRGVLS